MKQAIKIEIEVPDGYKAVYDKETQKVEIVKIGLPKTWEEFCGDNPIKKNEYFIDGYGEIIYAAEKHRATNLKNLLPNKETAEAFLALMQLIQLRDCYRQGWKPNWKEKTVKQNIICFEGVLGTDWSVNVQYVLSFQSKEIRNEFLKNFKDLIEQAKELI
jgi:hypothetical protein